MARQILSGFSFTEVMYHCVLNEPFKNAMEETVRKNP